MTRAKTVPLTPRPSTAALCAAVTAAILADLRRGVRPWHRPWSHPGVPLLPLRHDGTPYRGLNVLLLWDAAARHGHTLAHWMTAGRAARLGGRVRAREPGALVLYAGRLRPAAPPVGVPPDADAEAAGVPFVKAWTVWNAGQIDGLPDRFHAPRPATPATPLPIARADRFFRRCGATVRHGGDVAAYSPSADLIRMPPMGRFRDAESYYATLAHEHVHWTGHPKRLGRDLGRQRRGDAGYALEELVAELGAALLCARLALTPEPLPEHAAYIAEWLTVLERDPARLLALAGHAQRAVDWLEGLQDGPEPTGLALAA